MHEAFQSNPNSVPLSWLALLYVVLSVSVTSLDEDTPLLRDLGRRNDATKDITVLSTRYRAAAFRCLQADGYMFRQTLHTLQALILMSYGISHSHGDVWSLLGMTYHMALALGCHVDPEHFGLDVLECENRRRCWTGLMMLYTIQNISCGNIHQLQTATSSAVRLPANLDDDDLAAAAAAPSSNLAPPAESPRPTEMTYMLFKYRLYELCSRICDPIIGAGSRPVSPDVVAGLESDIQRERETWVSRYYYNNDENTYNNSSHQHHLLPAHQRLQLHILDGYSHQLTLLLHRPAFVNAPNDNNSTTSSGGFDVSSSSRKKCIEAALAELALHATLHRDGDGAALFAPYRWYGRGVASFHAFHAAVVLVAIIVAAPPSSSASTSSSSPSPSAPSSLESGGGGGGDTEQYRELQQAVTDAVRIFEEMAPRSRFCAKAAPALRGLL
ncbi:putative c6 zinc finger domain-containing protein [Diplodia seriata]|uniref:Putative c6 zinc finger domain-containing protein n=1 Tax=Diplodia seriata TaxID=420778 RepID=A0A0G2GJJ9_9PEZI|nr:putative c6 zinc finger domain-containing protein [Diplodia seriata]